MPNRIVLSLLALLVVIAALRAQDVAAPEAAIEAASAAAAAVLGESTVNYSFEILGRTTDSALGCAAVEGDDLPFEVTPVRVSLVYPDGNYTVYTSISGQLTVLCDPRFGEDALGAQVDPENACTATPAATVSAYLAPSLLVDGVFAAEAGTAYRVYGISSEAGWLQLGSDVGAGWVEATAVTLAGDCDKVPVQAVVDLIEDRTCFVTPLGGFTNVRQQATVESGRVGRIYENAVYQVTARNTAADWLFIAPAGWVATSVTRTIGDCTNLTVNDTLNGVGFAVIFSDDILNTDTSTILNTLGCPVDFAGYLAPRIAIGEASAQVEAGGIPNALRVFPSVDDAQAPRIGVIQPGRVIDRVLAGPACNQGIVWWLVEIDGTQGWTAESSAPSDAYFLAPTSEIVGTPTPTQAAISADDAFARFDGAVRALVPAPDGLIVQADVPGFGDGIGGVVALLDRATAATIVSLDDPSGVRAVAYAESDGRLALVAGNGQIIVTTPPNSVPDAVLGTVTGELAPQIAFTPDGGALAVAACADDACTAGTLRLLDATTGAEQWSQTLADVPLALAIMPAGDQVVVALATGVSFYGAEDGAARNTWSNSDGYAITDLLIGAAGEQVYVTGCNDADDPCSAGRIALIDQASAEVIGVVASHESAAQRIAANPDGTRFSTLAAAAPEIIERNAATGQETRRFTLPDADITALAYRDADTLFVGTADGRVLILSAD